MADEPFRTQVPNIVDDMGLDPYERALYVHYRRVCGNNSGSYCYETVKTTAQKLKMSDGQVSESRKTLTKKGLILVQTGRPVIVTVVNIWDLNEAYYRLEHRPDIDGWTVEQVKLWLADIHTVNVHSHNDSNIATRSECNLTEDDKSASDIHTVNEHSPSETNQPINDNMSSNIHTVKQRSKSLIIDSTSRQESNRERESRTRKENLKPIPAIEIHREIFHIELNQVQVEEIINEVGDTPASLEKWRLTLRAWAKAGYEGKNVTGQLEWFKNGVPVHKNGATNGHSRTHQTGAARGTLKPRPMDEATIRDVESEIAELERRLEIRGNPAGASP